MPTRSRIDRRSDLLVGGLQFEKHGAKSVVAASDSHSRLADPIVLIERPRSVSQSEDILVYRPPSSVTEAVRLSMSRIEHLPLFHHGQGLRPGIPYSSAKSSLKVARSTVIFTFFMIVSIFS